MNRWPNEHKHGINLEHVLDYYFLYLDIDFCGVFKLEM